MLQTRICFLSVICSDIGDVFLFALRSIAYLLLHPECNLISEIDKYRRKQDVDDRN